MGKEIPYKGSENMDNGETLLREFIAAANQPPIPRVEITADRGGIAVNGNKNLVFKCEDSIDYKSLVKAVESETELIKKTLNEAVSIKHEIKWFQSGIWITFVVYAVVLWFFEKLANLFPSLHQYSAEAALIPVGVILVLGFCRTSTEKRYFHFLESILPYLKKREQRLLRLYGLTCKKFGDTPLFRKIQENLDLISAFEQEYEALSRTKVAKKLYPWI